MRFAISARLRVKRFIRRVLPAVIILACGIAAVLGFLVYQITHPGAVPEAVNPSHYLMSSLDVIIPSGKYIIPGWWIPGLKDAPGIILAPGYGMSRSDTLSLAAALHEKGFNLLIYDQLGSGAAPRGGSTLGLNESIDMLAALQFIKDRPEVDGERLGIWGLDVGARAALQAAASMTEVRVIAVDGAFEFVSDFLDLKVKEDLGWDHPLLQFGCRQIFRLAQITSVPSIDDKLPLAALSDRSILFIQGENREELGQLTAALYDAIEAKKEMISLKSARVRLMSGEDLKNYDNQVANFFHLNLPSVPE